MIFNLYAIKDELSEFASPITIQTEDQAKRYFQEMVLKNDMMKNNPEDFSIYHVGSYDTKDGKITPNTPKLLVRAKSFLKKENENG